ncbi:hypothetical protein MMC14_003412 [Varicellaria rhodocarpa]|nr:hypothetical protein [Varicellaria rhodocarpa]
MLRNRSYSFTQAFLNATPPFQILNEFFTSRPKITEHGPQWANQRLPFLASTFYDRATDHNRKGTCDDYFTLLANTLSFHPNEHTFPPAHKFIVDATAGAVSVVAHARFTSVKTGKSWEEDFIYKLSEFDGDGMIGHWEIWADPLSAWDTVGG